MVSSRRHISKQNDVLMIPRRHPEDRQVLEITVSYEVRIGFPSFKRGFDQSAGSRLEQWSKATLARKGGVQGCTE
jgi:hypothetical protein